MGIRIALTSPRHVVARERRIYLAGHRRRPLLTVSTILKKAAAEIPPERSLFCSRIPRKSIVRRPMLVSTCFWAAIPMADRSACRARSDTLDSVLPRRMARVVSYGGMAAIRPSASVHVSCRSGSTVLRKSLCTTCAACLDFSNTAGLGVQSEQYANKTNSPTKRLPRRCRCRLSSIPTPACRQEAETAIPESGRARSLAARAMARRRLTN